MLSVLGTGLFSQSAGIGELDWLLIVVDWYEIEFISNATETAYSFPSTCSKLTRQTDGNQNAEFQKLGLGFFLLFF